MQARTPIDHDRVARAAIGVIDESGFEALSLSTVAEELGVGPSALYTHVDGLAGLHHVAAVESTRRLVSEVRDAAIGTGGDAAIHAVATAYRGFATGHPGRFTATLRVAAPTGPLVEADAELDTVFLLLGRARGLQGEAADQAARNVRRAIHGFVVLEHTTGHRRSADGDFAALIDALCAMLATQTQRERPKE